MYKVYKMYKMYKYRHCINITFDISQEKKS